MKQKKIHTSNLVFLILSYFGGYVCNVIYISIFAVGKFLLSLLKAFWRTTKSLRRAFVSIMRYMLIFALTPIKRLRIKIRDVKSEIEYERKINGEKAASKMKLNCAARVFFGKRGIVVTLMNYIAPVVSIFFLFSVVTYAANTYYAVKLTVNGHFIGYIENEQIFSDAQEVLQKRINYVGSDVNITLDPSFSLEQIGYSETLTKYQVADLMLQNSGVSLVYAYGFYINDNFYGAVENYHDIQDTLNGLLKAYETGDSSEKVQFVDNISYDKAGLFLEDSIIDSQPLIDIITSTKGVSQYYEVQYGDSHTLIGDTIDMTQAEIEALNPGFTESDLHIGDKIKMNATVPFLSVSVTKTLEYDTEVGYETEYIDDSSLYVGTSRVTKEGENGTNHVIADVTYINGQETKRDIKKVTVVTAPVDEEVAIGTKPTPAGSFSNQSAAYGKFIWPVEGCYISERIWWNGGYSGHSGIDLAGISHGQTVYAAASGTVVLSQWYYDYGYCVMIYHEELGLTTLYGHCSDLYVSVGQYVSQGQAIAAAGSTGRSTGVHVHFEVRKGGMNGTILDPELYLD